MHNIFISHIFYQTDGLSDNVHAMEISQITSLVMRQGLNEERSAQDLADRLVEYARVCMFKKDKVSPFQSWSLLTNLFNIDNQSSF